MKRFANLIILAALVAAVAGIAVMKQTMAKPAPAKPDAPAPAEMNPVNAQPLPRLVDFGSDKCIPCKMMAPILEELKQEYAGKFEVQFIDVWKDDTEKIRHHIEAIPTQIFFDASGKELFRHVGFFSKEDILGKWNELGVLKAG